MSINTFSSLISEWEDNAEKQLGKTRTQLSVYESDLPKIKALAKVYSLSEADVTAGLMHQAILEVEEKMPYVPGTKVIRVEEGSEVYEDVGPMARYLEILRELKEGEKA